MWANQVGFISFHSVLVAQGYRHPASQAKSVDEIYDGLPVFPDPVVSRQIFLGNLGPECFDGFLECRVLWRQVVAMHYSCFLQNYLQTLDAIHDLDCFLHCFTNSSIFCVCIPCIKQ